MVAVKVASFSVQSMFVMTLQLLLSVFIFNPVGAFRLSGETALAIAMAVLVSGYSSVIVACKSFTI
jgi:hypothetical protein